MIYLFQRTIQNSLQWIRPSPGRLGPSGEGKYVQENGFGHEDWNFNRNLLIDSYLYGYCYYEPALSKRDVQFNIAFGTYTNKQWYLIGFYLGCEFVEDPPVDKDVVKQKITDLKLLGNSLGNQYRNLSDEKLLEKVIDDVQWLKWRVLPENAVRTNQPVPIPKSIFDTKNYHITNPTQVDKNQFEKLYSLAESGSLIDYIEEDEFPEGQELERKHKTRERNQALIKKAKEQFKQKHGCLCCEICGFDFSKTYGEIGEDFIEAHHTIPISELSVEVKTKIDDIAMVCSNCHRMLHRKRPWLGMGHLKALIRNEKE